MKIPIVFKGKKYKVTYFEYLAYQNHCQLDKIEKKINQLLNKSSDQCSNDSTDESKKGTKCPPKNFFV
mgnify:CR=1 FL=1